MTTDQAYVANYSRMRLLMLALLCLLMLGGALWMAGLFGEPPLSRRWPPEMVKLIGWVGSAFFGLCFFAIVERLRRAGEAFRIDAQGITHAQTVKEHFGWHEITMLRPVEVANQPMLCYEVLEERLARIGGLRGRLASANRSMTGCSFALALSGTDAKMEELLAAVERFAPEHLLTGEPA